MADDHRDRRKVSIPDEMNNDLESLANKTGLKPYAIARRGIAREINLLKKEMINIENKD